MPKNQFQRPLPVKHTNQVPRHGKPQPQRKVEVKRPPAAKEPPALPTLEALLARSGTP